MKKIIVKRLVYTNGNGKVILGGIEYDKNLTDGNILNSIHEFGKTRWINNNLWLMHNGRPIYHVTVEPFIKYKKSWYDYIFRRN